jgi:large subunit ribosomal protein L9
VEVILLEEVGGLGKRGTTVRVAPGYARNFLLPRQLAIPAKGSSGSLFRTLAKQRDTRDSKLRQDAEAFAARLAGTRVTIAAKVGEEGLLFGSVTAADVADGLVRQGIEIDRRQVQLDEHLKHVGEHAVSIRLFGGVSATVTVEVVAE